MGNPPKKVPLTLQQKIIVSARGKLGKKIDKGECTDVVEAALREAGGQTLHDLGESDQQHPGETDRDYSWGDEINLKDARPGDILQFKDHEVLVDTTVTVTFPDGTVIDNAPGSGTDTQGRGHHTAIIDEPITADGTVKTIDQNVKPKGKVVQKKILDARDSSKSTVVSKLMKHPTTGKMVTAKVETTVTKTVAGQVKAYRARAKP